MNKVEAYKCSDGFLTESVGVYKRREKVLREYENMRKNGKYFGRSSLNHDLSIAELSDEKYKQHIEQKKIQKLYDIWKKSKPEYICKKCMGWGWYTWTDSGYGADRYYNEDCEDCNGSGITEAARQLYLSGKWLKEAKMLEKKFKETDDSRLD